MGRLQLDTQKLSKQPQFDSQVLEKGRQLLKHVKHREAGWEQAAQGAADLYQDQALRFAAQSERQTLLSAVASKLTRIGAKAARSPQFSYALLKMQRQLAPQNFPQDVMDAFCLATVDISKDAEARRVSSKFAQLRERLMSAGCGFDVMAEMAPVGKELQAFQKRLHVGWLRDNAPALQSSMASFLLTYMSAAQANSVAERATAELDTLLSQDVPDYTTKNALCEWLWGAAVRARSKPNVIYPGDCDSPIEAYFERGKAAMQPLKGALERLLSDPLENASMADDFEVVMNSIEALAERFVQERPNNAAHEAAEERLHELVQTRSTQLAEASAVRATAAMMVRSTADAELPIDLKVWNNHCQRKRDSAALEGEIDRIVTLTLAEVRQDCEDFAVDDEARLRERAKYRAESTASNKSMMLQLDILQKAKAEAEKQAQERIRAQAQVQAARSQAHARAIRGHLRNNRRS